MPEATIIYPHQLFSEHPALLPGRVVFLIEDPLFITEFPTHCQKALLHRLSLKSYEQTLRGQGYTVTYIESSVGQSTASILTDIIKQGFTHLHIVDTTDNWLEKRITDTVATHGAVRTWYDSPLFLLPKAEAMSRYTDSKRHLARFYRRLREDKKILLTEDGEPVGGAWSYDSENRQKLPKNLPLPADPTFYTNEEITAAQTWLDSQIGEFYGETSVWLPYTSEAAAAVLADFIRERFVMFGPYEDAITPTHTRLFHSTLSPLLNIGLLTPQQVLDTAITYATTHSIPLPSLEGFIRQILGWREFIRAAYEVDGTTMRTRNFWQHKRKLPSYFWTGHTGLIPLDTSINKALTYGYNHHIERLMVLGNFMLLCQTDPDDVYRWFMAMYVDAYDWVMVPNVYGMSQFADGGLFATKPYISGSNYLRTMSHFPKGDWESTWDALYWNFIDTHQTFFLKNHRLSMMPRLLAKMPEEKRKDHHVRAKRYLRQEE